MKQNASTVTSPKKYSIILGTLVIWFTLLFFVIWHWTHRFGALDYPLSILAIANFSVWWIVLLWGLYHSAFQVLGLFKKGNHIDSNPHLPEVAILYVTRDDFDEKCCKSCLAQNYPNVQVYICDDSETDAAIEIVDSFNASYSSCVLVRRDARSGFKAGNLNYAIQNHVKEEWILLVDADQSLPDGYLEKLVEKIPQNNEQIAFLQAAHEAQPFRNPFQEALSPEVELFYTRSLSVREKFGFIPMLGHGALLRRSSWVDIGKFPEIVSEDFAFALRAASHNQHGIYVEDVVSYEEYPNDFGGFMVRLRKWAGGTAELLKWSDRSFWFGVSSFVEKWDFGMQLLGYILAPLVVINAFLGSYVLYRLWNEYTVLLSPSLPYLYTFLLLVTFVIITSISKNFGEAARFYFWATAIYTASLPITGWAFAKHLFLSPTFQRTPKNGVKTSVGFWNSGVMILLGFTAIGISIHWYSPYSYVLIGIGLAYMAYPLFGQLTSENLAGTFSRLVVYLPGTLMLYAIYAMWVYGRY